MQRKQVWLAASVYNIYAHWQTATRFHAAKVAEREEAERETAAAAAEAARREAERKKAAILAQRKREAEERAQQEAAEREAAEEAVRKKHFCLYCDYVQFFFQTHLEQRRLAAAAELERLEREERELDDGIIVSLRYLLSIHVCLLACLLVFHI